MPRDVVVLEDAMKQIVHIKDTQLPNRIFKLRILVFAVVVLVLILLAYFYGVSPV